MTATMVNMAQNTNQTPIVAADGSLTTPIVGTAMISAKPITTWSLVIWVTFVSRINLHVYYKPYTKKCQLYALYRFLEVVWKRRAVYACFMARLASRSWSRRLSVSRLS